MLPQWAEIISNRNSERIIKLFFAFIYLHKVNVRMNQKKGCAYLRQLFMQDDTRSTRQTNSGRDMWQPPLNDSVHCQHVSIWKRCFVSHVNSLLVGMKRGVREALAVVLSEELAVAHSDVVDLVARATSVHPLPLLRGLLSFSVFIQDKEIKKQQQHTTENCTMFRMHHYSLSITLSSRPSRAVGVLRPRP